MRIFPILACACLLSLPACSGPSSGGAPDIAPAPGQTLARADKIELAVGSPAALVLKALGPADATEPAGGGRELWRYTGKRVEYVYASKNGGAATLVIGGYVADPQAESPGQSLLLTIVLDGARNVADFNFALMAY
jgi:hypothetical protein